jgi:hypothetical protein
VAEHLWAKGPARPRGSRDTALQLPGPIPAGVRTAALEGLPVSELRSKGARDGWKDYSAVGEEVIGV